MCLFTVGVNFNANIIIERPQKSSIIYFMIFFLRNIFFAAFIENKFHVSQMSLADISSMTCVSRIFFHLLNKQDNNEVIYNSLTAEHEIGERTNVFIIT